MVMSMAKQMLFYATLLNYCYCGVIWGISFESFGFESFLQNKLASKFDASFLYKKTCASVLYKILNRLLPAVEMRLFLLTAWKYNTI